MKNLNDVQLFDRYGALLTETQREICEKYYLYDLSLSEIAEEKGISKQAVSDALKTSRALMGSFEAKLHFNAETQRYSLAVSDMMTRVTRALGEFADAHPEFSEEIRPIADLVCVGEVVDLDKED